MISRRPAGRSPSIPPSSSAYPSPPADEVEEAALAISDQRTLYLVNIFIGNTARFLNNFAALCQDKLADVHRNTCNSEFIKQFNFRHSQLTKRDIIQRIMRLDASLTLLEANLRSTCPNQQFEDTNDFKAMGSSGQSMLSNMLPLDRSFHPPSRNKLLSRSPET